MTDVDDVDLQFPRRRIAWTGGVLLACLLLVGASGLLLFLASGAAHILAGAWVAVALATVFLFSQWLAQVRTIQRIAAATHHGR